MKSKWVLVEEKRRFVPNWLLSCFPQWAMLKQPVRWICFRKRTKDDLQWIPISEQCPPVHQTVLFYSSGGDVYQGRPCYGMHPPYWCGHSELNFGIIFADKGVTITHWLPLSALPEAFPVRVKHD